MKEAAQKSGNEVASTHGAEALQKMGVAGN